MTEIDSLQKIICDEHLSICTDFDGAALQDSWSWRNAHLARQLALYLIDTPSGINQKQLLQAIQLLEKNAYSLIANRFHDASSIQHCLQILRLFSTDKKACYALNRITLPIGNDVGYHLLKSTLFLKESVRLTDVHAKQASLAALLTPLRQNVGSCFATAPAIMIQQEQPLQCLSDISELLATGKLSRVVEGIEYTVPLSARWGVGDLLRPCSLSSLNLKQLAKAPGLIEAFKAAGLITKKQECEPLLSAHLHLDMQKSPFLSVTPDQLIKTVLLSHFALTEKKVALYKKRPAERVRGDFVIRAPVSMDKTNKACSLYLKAYEKAKTAFRALTDNALLKAWEFTLASLSEAKADFAKWNLYASLGVQPEEAHGIGNSLHQEIQKQIEAVNRELEEYQSNYEHLFSQAKYLEGRVTRASSESEAKWIQAEYQMRRQEMNRALSERDAIHEKGLKLQSLYPKLIEFYGLKIRAYFQEIYDAEMLDVSSNPYDDSPAGFRLLYKHGRSNPSAWTLIHTSAEYLEALSAFFIATEIEFNQQEEFQGLQKEIAHLITTALSTIKTPEFLEYSIYRLAKAYREPVLKNPLEHLDRVKRKPWSYISGGTIKTLVHTYWGLSPKEEKKWVESPTELLAFFIDTMKEIPSKPTTSFFSYSPTHAFLLKPHFSLFKKGWEDTLYTYTWIRDHWTFPTQRFLDDNLLDHRMMDYLFDKLLLIVPKDYRELIKNSVGRFTYSLSAPEFRERVIKALSYEKWLKTRLHFVSEELDSLLYRHLPLFPEHQLRIRLETVLSEMDEIDSVLQSTLLQLFDQKTIRRYTILTAEDLRNLVKELLIQALHTTRSSIFYHASIVKAMRQTGLCYPEPILVADTNWVKNVFGFTVNPGTAQVEFWRFDESGVEGRPLSIWEQYLNGEKQEDWGIFRLV